jgi:hypothetical protein
VVVTGASYRPPGVPGDLEDDECDYEADDRIGHRHSRCNDGSTRDHADRDETVNTRVVAVGHQGGAMQPAPGP